MAAIAVKNELARCVYAIPRTSRRGRPRVLSVAETLDKIVYVCKTGCQWAAIEGHDGVSYKTVYHWFRIWSKARVFENAFYNLASQRPLVADTSYVKNIYGRDVVGANSTDRGRNATKVSLLSDAAAVPIALVFHKGNKSDFHTLRHLLDEACRKTGGSLDNHISLYADKGYDSHTCRSICDVHGLEAHIPHRGQPTAWGGLRIAAVKSKRGCSCLRSHPLDKYPLMEETGSFLGFPSGRRHMASSSIMFPEAIVKLAAENDALRREVARLAEELDVWVPRPGESRPYCCHCGVHPPRRRADGPRP